jgi:hypothetical protein
LRENARKPLIQNGAGSALVVVNGASDDEASVEETMTAVLPAATTREPAAPLTAPRFAPHLRRPLELRLQIEMACRGLEAEAVAQIEEERGPLAAALYEALEGLSEDPVPERYARARRLARVVVHERLDSWRIPLEGDVRAMYERIALDVYGGVTAPFSGNSRLSYVLEHARTFLDVGALLEAALEVVGPPAYVWPRLRRRLHRDAQLFLRANVTRVVNDLQQRLEDSAHALAHTVQDE